MDFYKYLFHNNYWFFFKTSGYNVECDRLTGRSNISLISFEFSRLKFFVRSFSSILVRTYKYLYTSYFHVQVLKIGIDLRVTLITPLKVHVVKTNQFEQLYFLFR